MQQPGGDRRGVPSGRPRTPPPRCSAVGWRRPGSPPTSPRPEGGRSPRSGGRRPGGGPMRRGRPARWMTRIRRGRRPCRCHLLPPARRADDDQGPRLGKLRTGRPRRPATRRGRFLRGSRVPTHSRNGPCTPSEARWAAAARPVRRRQVVGPHRDGGDRVRRRAGLHQVRGDDVGRHDEVRSPPQRPPERRLVPATTPGWVGVGYPTPQQVVDRHHQRHPARFQGGQRHGMDDVDPGRGPDEPAVPGPRQQRPGQRPRCGAGDRGLPAGPSGPRGRSAGGERQVGGTRRVRRLQGVEPLEQAEDVGPDAAGRRPSQLLGQRRTRCRLTGPARRSERAASR